MYNTPKPPLKFMERRKVKNMTTAERIQQRRQELDLTQEQVANKMGLKDRSSITKLEKSGNYISFKKLEQVADVLDCSVAYLLGMVSDPHEEHPDIVPLGGRSKSERIPSAKTTQLVLPEGPGKESIEIKKAAETIVQQNSHLPLVKSVTPAPHINSIIKKQRESQKRTNREQLFQMILDMDDVQIEDMMKYGQFITTKTFDEASKIKESQKNAEE